MEVGEGLVCIIRVSPPTVSGGVGGARLHRQSVSLYLGWRWGRGSFASSECLPLCWGEGVVCIVSVSPSTARVGLIYIIHRVSPSTLLLI